MTDFMEYLSFIY